MHYINLISLMGHLVYNKMCFTLEYEQFIST